MPEQQTIVVQGISIAEVTPAAGSRFTAEQRAAIEARDPLIVLSAGAGSGKTSVLVERFVALVDEGVSPQEILAITFTEKAAAEMKERIVQRFEQRGDEANRRRTEAAYISTIHGLCARLLRENPFAARLDPSFGIIDGLSRGLFFEEQKRRSMTDEWFLEQCDRLPKTWGSDEPTIWLLVRDVALKAREFGADQAEEAGFDVEQHVCRALERVEEGVRIRWRAARAHLLAIAPTIAGASVSGPKRQADHRRMCDLLTELESFDEPDAVWMEEFDRVTGFTAGLARDPDAERIRKVLPKQKKELKSIRGVDPAEEERIEREHIVPLKMEIYTRAAALREAYDAFKRAEGLLDFEDLQRRALDLLDDAEVLAEYAGRFRHVLLDEAQDTNPVQMRLVERLVDGRNQLFAVGDVKQSIYGFRGASVGLFQALGRRADRPLSLVDNFRSRAEIIASVNEVGRRMWSGGEVAFEALAAKLPYPEVVERRVALSLYGQRASEETPGDDASPPAEPLVPLDAGELRVHEGAEIARWIRQAVEGGAGRDALQVFDRSSRSLRPSRYGDFALLTRTRTHNAVFEQCLVREGVPYVKDGGGGFFSGQEIADVVGALRVCLNPADELSLLAVLRSPMFGWGDADLVRLRLHAGRRGLWSALREGVRPERDGAVAGAFAILAEARALRSDLAPSELIEHLVERTHYRAALLHAARGRGAVANLEKLVDFARSYGAEDGHDLRRFVERVERAERFLKDENDAPLSADDAVTLATIHGSKGLEWPVVFLPSLETAFARRARGSCYSAPDGALLVEPKDDEGASIKPFSHYAVRARMAEREESEARRLFYVAMTRAREYLFLSGQPSYSDTATSDGFVRPVEWLGSELAIREHGDGEAEHAFGRVRLPVRFASPVRGGAATLAVAAADPLAAARSSVRGGCPVGWAQGADAARDAAQRIVERCGAAVAGGAGLRATTVTRLTYFHRCPRVYYYDLVLQIEEHPRARGKASVRAEGLSAVDLGSRVHELLEHADFAASPAAEAERLAGSAARLPDGDRERVRRLLLNVLSDPLMDRVRRARRIEREYPFYLEVGGTVLHGVIDLLFEDEDGRTVIVDYKSNDLAAPDRINVLTEYYRPQVELYALAAQRAGLPEPREAILYFLNKPAARTHRIDASRLAEVERATSAALARIGAGDWTTDPGGKCRGCGYRTRGFCEVGSAWAG